MEEIKGDLFISTNSLAHCISSDLAMGAGIALKFSELFGGKDELYKQNLKIGDVGWLKREGRYIYYLITKERYWHKPSYEDLTKCLHRLNSLCIEHKVEKISIPRLGCGLDKLQWSEVKKIIEKELAIKVVVYY